MQTSKRSHWNMEAEAGSPERIYQRYLDRKLVGSSLKRKAAHSGKRNPSNLDGKHAISRKAFSKRDIALHVNKTGILQRSLSKSRKSLRKSREHQKHFLGNLFRAKFSAKNYMRTAQWSPQPNAPAQQLRMGLQDPRLNFDLIKNIYTEHRVRPIHRKRTFKLATQARPRKRTETGELPPTCQEARAKNEAEFVDKLFLKYKTEPGHELLEMERVKKRSTRAKASSKQKQVNRENWDHTNRKKLNTQASPKGSNSPFRKFQSYFNSGTMPILFRLARDKKRGDSRRPAPNQPKKTKLLVRQCDPSKASKKLMHQSRPKNKKGKGSVSMKKKSRIQSKSRKNTHDKSKRNIFSRRKTAKGEYDEYSLLACVSKKHAQMSTSGQNDPKKEAELDAQKRSQSRKIKYFFENSDQKAKGSNTFSFKHSAKTERLAKQGKGEKKGNIRQKQPGKLRFTNLIESPGERKQSPKKVLGRIGSPDKLSFERFSTTISHNKKLVNLSNFKNKSHLNSHKVNSFFPKKKGSHAKFKKGKERNVQKVFNREKGRVRRKPPFGKTVQLKSELPVEDEEASSKNHSEILFKEAGPGRKWFNEYSLKKSEDGASAKKPERGGNSNSEESNWIQSKRVQRNQSRKWKKLRNTRKQLKWNQFADASEDETGRTPEAHKSGGKKIKNIKINLSKKQFQSSSNISRNRKKAKQVVNNASHLHVKELSRSVFDQKNHSVSKVRRPRKMMLLRQKMRSNRKGDAKNITVLSPILSISQNPKKKRRKFDFEAKEKEKFNRKNSKVKIVNSRKRKRKPAKMKNPPNSKNQSPNMANGVRLVAARFQTSAKKRRRTPVKSSGKKKQSKPTQSTAKSDFKEQSTGPGKPSQSQEKSRLKSESAKTDDKSPEKGGKAREKKMERRSHRREKAEVQEKSRQGKVAEEECPIEESPEKYLMLHSLIGKGSFGEVYLVQNRLNQQFYAMKILNKATLHENDMLRYAFTEKQVMGFIDHPYIVKLRYAFQNKNYLYLFMDYIPGGNLTERIERGNA